jgi:penicillin-binding protein 1A
MPAWRRLCLVLLPPLAVASLAIWCGKRVVEERAEALLRRAGFTARDVRFSWFGPLRLGGVTGPVPGGGRLTIETILLRWRFLGGQDARAHLSGIELRGVRATRVPLAAAWPEADFDVIAWTREGGRERLSLRQRSSEGDSAIEACVPAAGAEAVLSLARLDLATADVQWNGDTVLDLGRWSGRVTFAGSAARFESEGALHGEAVRMTPPRPLQAEGEGVPTPMDVEWKLHGGGDAVALVRGAARLAGLDVSVHGIMGGAPDRLVDGAIKARCELAAAFRTTGLTLPLTEMHANRFGTALLDLSMRGPLATPASLVIDPRLRFEPEPEVVQALSYLRAPFLYHPASSPGVEVDVRDGAPDFISIDAVPPLFQKALLVSEDAGFPHHPGIDLAEIVAAWAENSEDGHRIRGASTITQQLVKNLFLSNEKTYARKLKEAALALMVDAVVPKARLLEIYVNIIEWGPGLHGLVPAARHYFGKQTAELTPKEIAFLVCLIPSPVRYHQAHEAGKIGPGMEQLVRNLLAKLRSVDALDEDRYERALREELQFAPETETRVPPSEN